MHRQNRRTARKECGRLIVFEGPDGSGKTTLSQRLVQHLCDRGMPCCFFAFPGVEEGTLGKRVYDIHHEFLSGRIASIQQTSIQLLHIAAHLDAIETKIVPVIHTGMHVVLDRFWWSTWVYGMVDGAEKESLRSMIDIERRHWGSILPSVVFLIKRDTPYRMSHNARWEKLAREYASLAKREKHRCVVQTVKNDVCPDLVLRRILNHIGSFLVTPQTLQAPTISTPESLAHRTAARTDVNTHRVNVFSKLAPARLTIVYDTFWRFAAERQNIFFSRLAGHNPPWTLDPILQSYKFTNAYRASDRVSQYLIRNVIYTGDQSASELFFRTILFKIFNKIETWELLASRLGPITYADYSFSRYNAILNSVIQSGTAIYSSAYIMPSGGTRSSYPRKHTFHLKLIERMLNDGVPNQLSETVSMAKAFDILRSYPSIGDFLAYQYATDINYSTLTNFTEMEFVVPGPGAKDGVRKCFSDTGGLTEAEIIRVVAEQQNTAFDERGLTFKTLWERPLQLVDCQNLFCEVDKYARLKHPEIKGHSGRSRIKQRYRMNPTPIELWYPPKWGLNTRIEAERRGCDLRSQSASDTRTKA